MLSRKIFLAYFDLSNPFVIHINVSDYQLGAVIIQDGKPIAFYLWKLNNNQTCYTTTKQELLAIVEMLKEFLNILLGQRIVVYTDHKDLRSKTHN